ncbi:MAG: glycosyltransferase family 2 protein [Nitrospirota bacterium]
MNERTLSIIIPALNEEGSLPTAVTTVLGAIGDRFADYELLIFDDGSTDRTGAIADGLAAGNPHIRVIHNPRNMGFGYNYRRGVELARMEYVTMFPGDNEIPGEAIQAILAAVGSVDIVVPYISTPAVRSRSRQMISSAFVELVNLLFGLRLSYYNGPCVHRRSLLLSVPMRTHGFAYMAAILVRLIRSGHSYIEVPMSLQARQHGRSKAFKLKNIVSVLRTLGELFWEVRVAERHKYRGSVRRVESRA